MSRRHQVGRELDAVEARASSASASVRDQQRLGQPGHADQQRVAAGEQRDEQLLEHPLLADDAPLHLRAQLAASPSRVSISFSAVARRSLRVDVCLPHSPRAGRVQPPPCEDPRTPPSDAPAVRAVARRRERDAARRERTPAWRSEAGANIRLPRHLPQPSPTSNDNARQSFGGRDELRSVNRLLRLNHRARRSTRPPPRDRRRSGWVRAEAPLPTQVAGQRPRLPVLQPRVRRRWPQTSAGLRWRRGASPARDAPYHYMKLPESPADHDQYWYCAPVEDPRQSKDSG